MIGIVEGYLNPWMARHCTLLLLLKVLFASSRRGPGQEYVKSSLGSVIEDLVERADPLELHPIKVTILLESL